MLADSCEVCFTVLMQDRRGRVICVKCESDSMANAGQADRMTPTSKMSNGGGSNANAEERENGNVSNNSAISTAVAAAATTTVPRNEAFANTEEILTAEISKSAFALHRMSQQQGESVKMKVDLLKYIRECSETLKSIQGLK